MAYQMAATAVALNDLQGHSPVTGLYKCNPSNICAAFFTRFQLTVCSYGSSALAELLVNMLGVNKSSLTCVLRLPGKKTMRCDAVFGVRSQTDARR